MKVRMDTDRLISAIILIVVGILQMTGAYVFPLWLVVLCLGIMLVLNR